jgi:protein-tyrosine phosphatase
LFHFDECNAVLGWDEYRQPLTLDMLNACANWYSAQREMGHLCMIHCAAGLHRSPTIALALLMKMERQTYGDAWAKLTLGMQRYANPAKPMFETEDIDRVVLW